jgi:hypothetical protein
LYFLSQRKKEVIRFAALEAWRKIDCPYSSPRLRVRFLQKGRKFDQRISGPPGAIYPLRARFLFLVRERRPDSLPLSMIEFADFLENEVKDLLLGWQEQPNKKPREAREIEKIVAESLGGQIKIEIAGSKAGHRPPPQFYQTNIHDCARRW